MFGLEGGLDLFLGAISKTDGKEEEEEDKVREGEEEAEGKEGKSPYFFYRGEGFWAKGKLSQLDFPLQKFILLYALAHIKKR